MHTQSRHFIRRSSSAIFVMALASGVPGAGMAAIAPGSPASSIALPDIRPLTETVRPVIGLPARHALTLLETGDFQGALQVLGKLDAMAGKTPYEITVIERIRFVVAHQARDFAGAVKAIDTLLDSGQLNLSDQLKFKRAKALVQIQQKDFSKAVESLRAIQSDADTSDIRHLLVHAYLQQQEYALAGVEVEQLLRNEASAGIKPAEDDLKVLAYVYSKTQDDAAYRNALIRLTTHYPKSSYWDELLWKLMSAHKDADMLRIHIYRLALATNRLRPLQYLDFASLLLRDRLPAEASKVVEHGFNSGKLGTGDDAARHQRLKQVAQIQRSKFDQSMEAERLQFIQNKRFNGLLAHGYELIQASHLTQGIETMEFAMRQGDLKQAETPLLMMGLAYASVGRKAEAIAMLKTIYSPGPLLELARYWIMQINNPLKDGD